jgi:ribonuclease P/MRP protein subunit POP1
MLYLESGRACFPFEFPETQSYQTWWSEEARKRKENYDRKPPAKRPNYIKLNITSPFQPDIPNLTPVGPCWAIRSSKLQRFFIETIMNGECAQETFQKRCHLSKTLDFDRALFPIHVRPFGKGRPQSCALLYQTTTEKGHQILESILKNNRNMIDAKETQSMDLQIVGTVIAGDYSLNRAQGYGNGVCTVKTIENVVRLASGSKFANVLMMRNTGSHFCRPVLIELITA